MTDRWWLNDELFDEFDFDNRAEFIAYNVERELFGD
jgi:hypothetical protein